MSNPKNVIPKISSKLEAAIKDVGIPFATPYLPLCNIMRAGTTTAGETAPNTNPIEPASAHGKPKMK